MPTRPELYASLAEAMRDQAGRAVMFHQAVADRFGLNSTDIKCLDLARDEPQLTAGRLAEVTGMSTSAITAVLDRLERRGLIERQRDPADRRKVIVVPTQDRLGESEPIFIRLLGTVGTLLDGYTEAELELILGFVLKLNTMSREFTAQLSAEPLPPGTRTA
jgi:DNA-binding MarR family transcriptional regulator